MELVAVRDIVKMNTNTAQGQKWGEAGHHYVNF